jgi:hypothetical protein
LEEEDGSPVAFTLEQAVAALTFLAEQDMVVVDDWSGAGPVPGCGYVFYHPPGSDDPISAVPVDWRRSIRPRKSTNHALGEPAAGSNVKPPTGQDASGVAGPADAKNGSAARMDPAPGSIAGNKARSPNAGPPVLSTCLAPQARRTAGAAKWVLPCAEMVFSAWAKIHVCVYEVALTIKVVMLHCSMMANIDDYPAVADPAPADQVKLRSEPPLVFLGPNTQDHWIVEPPRDAVGDKVARVFTGHRAQYAALVYAYETFGNARFIPY